MKITAIIESFLNNLNISIDTQQADQINSLWDVMNADPLYRSVSKISDTEEAALKHFLDCLIPFSKDFPKIKAKNIIDLGTGGGFPSLIFAVMLPDSIITAVDARKKSVDFVMRTAEAIGLTNLKTVHSRIEDLGHDPLFREKADLVVSRALSAVRTLLEYSLPLTRVDGYNLYMKGPKLEEELNEAANSMKIFGLNEQDIIVKTITEPLLPFERNLLYISKKKPCPSKYPRRSGMPTSKPL